MNITVVRKDPADQWDRELIQCDGSLFLSRVWVEAVAQSHQNRHPVFLYFYSGNQLVAMLAGLDIPIKKGNESQLFILENIILLA